MKKINQKQSSFSILEVNVILLLLAITMFVAYNFFRPLYQKKQLNFTVQKIISQLEFLRAQAIIHQTTYSAKFENNALQIKKMNPFHSYQVIYEPSYSYRINKPHINFYPNGSVSFLSIFVSNSISTQRIIIASTGRIRTQQIKE